MSGGSVDYIFYQAIRCFTNRKLLLLFACYVISSLGLFAHYAMKKYSIRDDSLPPDENFRIVKVAFPTIAFGLKHVIHLHLALLPLTMCRFSVAHLSNTFLHRYLPFESLLKCHAWLGYIVIFLVFLAFCAFMTYYGILCSNGEKEICQKFGSEIMITGYIVFILFMSVGISSYYRHTIRYEWFYKIHQIVFVAFFVSIMHTIDKVHRTQGGRSQAYKWFTLTLLLYVSDRLTVSSVKRNRITTVVGYQAMNKTRKSSYKNEKDNGIIILKVAKPESFRFKSGHYIKIKLPLIDSSWHPFTIASSPDSDVLEFHLNVHDVGSWTYQLLDLIRTRKEKEDDLDPISVEIMGPFGNPIAHYGEHSDALLIGSGTGFISALSLLQQHITQCISLDPSIYLMQKEKHRDRLDETAVPHSASQRRNSLESTVIASTKDRKLKIIEARNEMYKHALMFVPFTLDFTSLVLVLSWNNLPFQASSRMEVTICVITILSQMLFLALAVKRGSCFSMKTCLDFLMIILGAIGDWYWMSYVGICNLKGTNIFTFCVVAVYILLRLWYEICSTVNSATFHSISKRRQDFLVYDNLTFVWMVRSAKSVEEILPQFEKLWTNLEYAWGLDLAQDAFKMKIYCTDNDTDSCHALQEVVEMSPLNRTCELNFHKLDFGDILKEHSSAINAEKSVSSSILSFCGSDFHGSLLSQANVLNSIDLTSRGLTHHSYDIKIDSYGAGTSSKTNKLSVVADGTIEQDLMYSNSSDLELKYSNSSLELTYSNSSDMESNWNIFWESHSLLEIQQSTNPTSPHSTFSRKASMPKSCGRISSSSPNSSLHSTDLYKDEFVKSNWPENLKEMSITCSSGVGAAVRSQLREIEVRKAEIDKTIRTRSSMDKTSPNRPREKRISIDTSYHSAYSYMSYLSEEIASPRTFMVNLVSSKKEISTDKWSGYLAEMSCGSGFNMTFRDKYRLGETVGGGGIHTVVKEAMLKQENMKFAAKIIYKPKMQSADKKRKEKEIKILSEIRHDNVYRIWDVFHESHFYIIVSEYLRGGTLLDKILQKGCFEEVAARKAMKFLLSAVQHFHSLMIVHRDLRLQNIMIASPDDESYVKIIDFEFATKAKSEECLLTQCGTPLYMAPELLQGAPYGSKVDMWSLGVVCYCMLVGYFPFMSSDPKSLNRLIKKGKFIFHGKDWGTIPLEARQFIQCLLNTNPDKRFDATKALDHPWIKAGEMQTIDLGDGNRSC